MKNTAQGKRCAAGLLPDTGCPVSKAFFEKMQKKALAKKKVGKKGEKEVKKKTKQLSLLSF